MRRWLEKAYSPGLFHVFDEKETEIRGRGRLTRERITRRQSVIPLVRTSPPTTHVLKHRLHI